ncbi:MAG: prepilin-type N-terminal cleavage/methylation domain-containing protein [Magnetococcus sp. YQC-5]
MIGTRRFISNDCRGMTFIEILVSMVAITMVASGIGATMVGATKNPDLSREYSQATFILQSTTDTIIGYKRSSDVGKKYANIPTAFASVTVGTKTFTRAVTVTTGTAGSPAWCPSTAGFGCKLVQVMVTGPSGLTVRSTTVLMNYED